MKSKFYFLGAVFSIGKLLTDSRNRQFTKGVLLSFFLFTRDVINSVNEFPGK